MGEIERLLSEELLQGIKGRRGFFSSIEHLEKFVYHQQWLFSRGVTSHKTLTTDNLRKQGLIIMDWYFMCKNQRESVAHHFLHCAVAQELQSLVFCLFGVFR